MYEVVVLARFLLTGIALLLAFLAAVTWSRRREAPGANVFAILIGSMAVYTFGYAGEIAQTTIAGALFWLHVEYLALPWAGALWLLAACRHNGRKVWAPVLFMVPVITFAGHYSNFDNLFYSGPMEMVRRGPFSILTVQRGPLSTLDNAFLLVCFLAGSWIYLSGLRSASALYRRQAIVLVLASLVPFIGYFGYLVNISPWGLDTGPVTLGVTCLLLYYGIFHCGIFNLAPVGRNLIFNSMRDAALILDMQDRLLDYNPAALALLPELRGKVPGDRILDLVAAAPGLAAALGRAEGLRAEGLLADPFSDVSLQPTPEGNSYEAQFWPLFSGTRQLGRAMIFADVTAEMRLREDLRLRADTDPLTGVANRRLFQRSLEMECFRFSRTNAPISLMMIDLDYFKTVNDRYGHPVGDAVLTIVASRLLTSLRKTDLLARFGGEEFSVLLPETPAEGASVIADRVRGLVGAAPVEVDGILIPISVSVGVTSHAGDLEAVPELLLKKADLALYRAKAAGRNRVEAI